MAPSPVWALVTKSQDGKTAKCNKCGKVFQNPSTSTCRYHLEQIHFFALPKLPSKKRQRKENQSVVSDGDNSNEDDPAVVPEVRLFIILHTSTLVRPVIRVLQ